MLSPARTRFALLALALGGFGIGCTEFVAIGLLPDLARDLLPGVYAVNPEDANAQAGALIAAYAAGVVVGAPTIAAFAARFSRKKLLIGLTIWFALATFASALLPSFGLVLVARFVAALPHGAYFGVASLVATSLMGPGNRGRGVAFVIGGLTIANVIGVPSITWLGQQTSWRVAYVAVGVVFALTSLAVILAVPRMAANPGATVRNELRAFTVPQVWFALAIGAIGFGGLFSAYTYVSPIATDVARLPVEVVPLLLIAFGVGMTIGNFVGGHYVDRGVKRAIIVFFVGVIASLAGLLLTASVPILLFVFIFLIGATSSALSPAIQVRLMDVAGDSQTIAAAINHSSLNIGNALGAYLGGLTIAAGLGYLSPIVVGLLLSIAGVVLALVAFVFDRRATAREVPAAQAVPIDAL
ncbi:MFS transporter [Amnibacterium flavum]|uniref:MFS transporter n=1 Tax=Amnibacterium flavum TaxID=2173173 RepID=A0A2V1HN04_9MICO|nr:MFS transporter [Amnibacterium flavum]PVZ93918.1 MFS transporter [Amnibacterium flavum]